MSNSATFYQDRFNRLVIGATIILLSASILIWFVALEPFRDHFYWQINVHPLVYLAIVLPINTALAYSVSSKDQEMTHLLLSASLIIVTFELILELFYLSAIK